MIPTRSTIHVAFTLVEVIVSMAVFTLLIVLVAQLTNSASLTITGSRKHMDADSQAQAIFDRMAADIGHMVKRSDVDCIVKGFYADAPTDPATMPGNDSIFFFSEVPGYYSPSVSGSNRSSFTLVGYRASISSTPAYALERLSSALSWEPLAGTESITFLTYAPGQTTPINGSSIGSRWSTVGTRANNYTDGVSADYQAIGDQVFRYEYCYLLKDGTFSNTPFIAPHTSAQGLQDVSAIVVAIAILDNSSRKITANLSQLSAALPDANPPTLMAEAWKNAINNANFASTAGIPQSAAGQIRIYQRFFYLNNK